MRKLTLLMVMILLVSCQTAPKTAEIEIDPPIPEPPSYPVIEFRWDAEEQRLWTTLEEGRRLAKYRADVEAYTAKMEVILEQLEVRE